MNRIIAKLDVKSGHVIKGIEFEGLKFGVQLSLNLLVSQ
jgi:imidazole glycerol phosphate synthase subunit HisF